MGVELTEKKNNHIKKPWETSHEVSSARESCVTTEGFSDGPIWTTKRLTWVPPSRLTHSEVALTPKALSSRRSVSKPSSQTLLSESASGSSSSRTARESQLSSQMTVA